MTLLFLLCYPPHETSFPLGTYVQRLLTNNNISLASIHSVFLVDEFTIKHDRVKTQM